MTRKTLATSPIVCLIALGAVMIATKTPGLLGLFLTESTLLAQADPCCSITAIDTRTGMVTAVISATGQVFQFKVNEAARLEGLTVGQGVYANVKTRQVSLDGKTTCCRITALGPIATNHSVDAAASASSASGNKKTGSVQVTVPTTTVTPAESGPTDIAIRGRPGTGHPGTDRGSAPLLEPPSGAQPDVVVRRAHEGDLGPESLIRFRVANRGFGPIDWGEARIFIGRTPAEATFRESARYAALAAGEEVTISGKSAAPEFCRDNWVRVAVSGSSTESNLANNELAWQLARLCPDLVITGIKQNWEDRNTRYRVHITVSNAGNVRMSKPVRLSARAWSSGSCNFVPFWPAPSIGARDQTSIGPLDPGESVSVSIGAKHVATRTLCVKAYVDSEQELEESSETNNMRSRMFGPQVF